MKYFIIVASVVLVLFLICVILITTKICAGGDLFSCCGKMLFPWTKKVKLPSGKYCCINCYVRDLKMFSEIRKDSENDTFKFYAKDEELPRGNDE